MNKPISEFSAWPNRIARTLAVVAFFLIFVGGLVTTTAAGMAVPDWPNTYGYNMFLYPVYDWFFGPWDLFVEHGHRLLGTLAGILAILLVAASFWVERGRFIRWFSVLLLLLVVLQGALGGIRVLRDDRILANVHGCIGPLFFALVIGFCVLTSRWYRRNVVEAGSTFTRGSFNRARLFAQILLGLSYLQLVVGSLLRHANAGASPRGFPHLVYTHIGLALVILFGTWFYWSMTRRLAGTGLRWQVNLLAFVVFLQAGLGLATWVMKYGFPAWLDQFEFAAGFVVPEKTMSQTSVVTAHMAVGSAILCLWTVHVVRFRGLFEVRALSKRDTMSCAVPTVKV